MIMDIKKMVQEQIMHAQNFTIINIFKTDFPEYDRLLAFIPIQAADVLFEMGNTVSGLVLNVNKNVDVDMLDFQLDEKMKLYPYMTTTWKDRHSGLLEWLTIYDIPLKIIMIFITGIAIFNIAASLWMIILEKTREFGILQSMGLTKSQVRKIIIKEGVIIGLSGSMLGILLSLCVLYLESVYHFIQLPNDIYFMNYLPIKISLAYFVSYPIITFLITIGFSFIPAKHACRIAPSEALRYE